MRLRFSSFRIHAASILGSSPIYASRPSFLEGIEQRNRC